MKKKPNAVEETAGPDCHCKRLKCFEIVNEENRARLIKSFNALPSKDVQDSHLASLITITVTEISRHRPRSEAPKSSNNKLFLQGFCYWGG